ncbi:putative ABC transporter permease [Parablautia muri]|nr:putative ABC transporter permease [Parablautia muri]
MKNKKLSHEFDYYVLLFFSLAFIGWLWEVALYFFTEHALINRGVYRGPYLPVYGVGGLLLCILFHSLRSKPLLVFGASALLCSVLEYLTSYFLERRWGIRWWDYSNHLFNISGRICLTGALIFGAGGAALVCVFLPLYEKIYLKVHKKWRIGICIVLLALFVADGCYCAMRPNVGYGISSS